MIIFFLELIYLLQADWIEYVFEYKKLFFFFQLPKTEELSKSYTYIWGLNIIYYKVHVEV